MRFLIFLLAAFFVSSASLGQATAPEMLGPPGSVFAFGDEFTGTELNQEMWGLGINSRNVQNEAVDCAYRLDNISFRDGLLVFTQKREQPAITGKTWTAEKKFNYSSGGIHTRQAFELRNNMYLELRCRLPANDAGYGAFWTVSNKVGEWKPADLLEIDMFEFIANQKKTRFWSGLWWHDFTAAELHEEIPKKFIKERSSNHFFVNEQIYKAHFGDGGRFEGTEIDFYDFITFGLRVTDEEMTWHLVQDGPAWKAPPYFRFTGGTVHNRTYGRAPDLQWERGIPERLHAQININYALRNAEWAGGPVRDEQLPAEMILDYIRVYHLAND